MKLREQTTNHPGWNSSVIISLMSLICLLPALFFGQMLFGDDIAVHLRWQRVYPRELWSGIFMPRWLESLNDGFGSPAFFIYGPFAQWAASTLYPVLPTEAHAELRLALSLVVASALGGIGIFKWCCRLVESRAAARAAALLYILLPYHLYVDTYHRAAVAELWGFAVTPWVLVGVASVFARERFGVSLLAVAIAAMFLSHPPSALMFMPFVAIYVICHSIWDEGWRSTGLTVLAGCIGTLLACGYLATALSHTRYINVEMLFDDGGPRWWLFLANDGTAKPGIFSLVFMTLLFHLLLTAFFLLSARTTFWGTKNAPVFWLCLATILVTAFLQTAAGSFFWFPSNIFNKLQFPWRLQALQTVALAALAALVFAHLECRKTRWRRSLAGAVLLACAVVSAGLLAARVAHYNSLGKTLDAINLYEDTRDAREYRLGESVQLSNRFGGSNVLTISGNVTVTVDIWRSREIRLMAQATAASVLLIHQFLYTGWQYRVDGSDWIAAGSEGPLLTVEVPVGNHIVELRMPSTQPERIGGYAALGGAVAWMACFVFALATGEYRFFAKVRSFGHL